MRSRTILAVALAALALGGCVKHYDKTRAKTSEAPSVAAYQPAAPEKRSQMASLGPVEVMSQKISCVPYARSISGIELRGDAWKWWDAASGLYDRGSQPKVGSIIVMKKVKTMPRGHVAFVTAVLNTREIQVDHANWRKGEIHKGALIRDVSPKNDWSLVQVWYPPIGDYGTGKYPVSGFIYQPGNGAPAKAQTAAGS